MKYRKIFFTDNSGRKVIDYPRSLAKAEARIAELEDKLTRVVSAPDSVTLEPGWTPVD